MIQGKTRVMLTDAKMTEIREAVYPFSKAVPVYDTEEVVAEVQVGTAHAQAQKIVEWGNEPCPHLSKEDIRYPMKRHRCGLCWQELEKEVLNG